MKSTHRKFGRETAWIQRARKIDRGCVQESTKPKKQGKIRKALPACQLCSRNATLRHYDISRARFQGTAQRTHLHQTSRKGSSEVWRRQSWQIDQEHVWNSRCFPHLATRLCESDLWRVGVFQKDKHSAALFHNPNQDVRMVMHGDDTQTRRQSCQIQIHSERHGDTWIRRFRCVESWGG